MKRSALAAALGLVILSAPSFAHKFYASLAQVERTARGGLEVSIRFFPDDLEAALHKATGRTIALKDTPEFVSAFEPWLNAAFSLQAGEQRTAFKCVGLETTVEAAWVHVEAPWPEPLERSSMKNAILLELFPDQKNTVNFVEAGKRSSVVFSADKTEAKNLMSSPTGADPAGASMRPGPRLLFGRVMVPDVPGLDEEDHILGDVGGVIGDPFNVAADQDQAERAFDGAGVGHHVGQEEAEHTVLELIDLVVAEEDLTSQVRVPSHERIEGVARHLLGDFRHLGDIDHRLQRRRLQETECGLRDIDRLIADAFEVRAHLHGRRDEAQVGGHRLLEGEHLQTPIIDLNLEKVHGGIALDHRFCELSPALHQADQGLVGLGLAQGPHVKEAVLQCPEVTLEVLTFHYPNLPVM